MAVFRPFEAVRPTQGAASQVAALPYDVMSSAEARAMAEDEPYSFLHIDRAEIDLPEGTDIYSDEVYETARDNLMSFKKYGILFRDTRPGYYIYREIMGERSQTGIVGCASIDEYLNGTIKKHELTVEEKETDRIRHVDACDANTGVIFLAFRGSPSIEKRMKAVMSGEMPLYDFVSDDGVVHTIWKVEDETSIALFERAFEKVPCFYIADGHHRAASAVRVGLDRRKAYPGFTGEEEYNYFLACAFPASELSIWDYNRVVRDLAGMSPDVFLDRLERNFEIKPMPYVKSDDPYALEAARPKAVHEIALYLSGKWYMLKARPIAFDPSDPVSRLDVEILQEKVLAPLLKITSPRTDKRIEFVGGIRGLTELVRKVDEGCAAAFAMYPTTMEDLMAIADAGRIMPPKSTWFEPKLRSGLFIHELDSRGTDL